MLKSLVVIAACVVATTVANANTQTMTAKPKKAKQMAAAAKAPASTAPAAAVSVAPMMTVPTASANLSLSSVMMHSSEGRTMIQINPVSESGNMTTKFESNPAFDEAITTQAVGFEMSRGLSNGYALNVSTDIGTDKFKGEEVPEYTNSGFSDIKVQITKLTQDSMSQSYLSGFATTGIGKAAIGSVQGDEAFEGNRFSGGVSLGGQYMKQTAALAGTYGYRVGGALVMPRSQDIKNDTPIYAVLETTGGHKLFGEFFGQTAPKGSWTLGGTVGMNTTLAQDFSGRAGPSPISATRNQLNVLGLKAFAAFTSGQIEFVPAVLLNRAMNTSGGSFSVESMDTLGLQLTTRLSL